MVTIYYKSYEKILASTDLEGLVNFNLEDVLWIDIVDPEFEERSIVENVLAINLQTPQQAEEIESSSRYVETYDQIITNSTFLSRDKETHNINTETVSFIIKNDILVSQRNKELSSFIETRKKMEVNPRMFQTCYHILVMIFEVRIDRDADLIESIAKGISNISSYITLGRDVDKSVFLEVTKYQELTMMIRESIIDKERVISGILKSDQFPENTYPKLRIMIKDINSLLDHTKFSFERLEYLQDTFMGLINIEQNKIIKIFTVASVAFMPPTLIASIYGMNFKVLPELGWTFGYAFALALMLISSLGTLLFFKKRNWL